MIFPLPAAHEVMVMARTRRVWFARIIWDDGGDPFHWGMICAKSKRKAARDAYKICLVGNEAIHGNIGEVELVDNTDVILFSVETIITHKVKFKVTEKSRRPLVEADLPLTPFVGMPVL